MQITLMEAYIIETLKMKGIKNEEIIKAVKEKQVADFENINDTFDYTILYSLRDNLPDILHKGYQIKFITMPGLMNLLKMKHNKVKDRDYKQEDTALLQLNLTAEEASSIKSWLSPNWTLHRENSTYSIIPAFLDA